MRADMDEETGGACLRVFATLHEGLFVLDVEPVEGMFGVTQSRDTFQIIDALFVLVILWHIPRSSRLLITIA
jgi:hypothetical protein